MIVVTGAGGFISSCLAAHLNSLGHNDLILVDDLPHKQKDSNLRGKNYKEIIHRDVFIDWFRENADKVELIFHYGARTDTSELDEAIFLKLNINYSKAIWNLCTEHQIPFIYASSAATYGDGALGFGDNHLGIPELKPLNPYGASKQIFDIWALEKENCPPFWYGLKFFNVYGPNEYHKGRMASVIYHAFHQIQKSGEMRLFRSHREDYKDGEQLRDFVYVKDLVSISEFLMKGEAASGIYNLGTGKARTFNDLVAATFNALEIEPEISYIDTPEDIRETYQYFTEAEMSKLLNAGYNKKFHSLEEGIEDYVKNYLISYTYM